MAEGGQIAVSSQLRELLQGDEDVVFGEERDVELRGLSGRQRVYGVRWEATGGG